jgi:nitrogen fixation-related uncharacterized protein
MAKTEAWNLDVGISFVIRISSFVILACVLCGEKSGQYDNPSRAIIVLGRF